MQFLAARPLRYLGKISYGLYVFHFAGIWVAEKITSRIGGGWSTLALSSLAVTVVVAVASYEVMEKPVLRWKRKFETVATRPP